MFDTSARPRPARPSPPSPPGADPFHQHPAPGWRAHESPDTGTGEFVPNGTYVVGPGYGGPPPKSRVTAAMLGILLGAVGAHRLYLGYTGKGILMALLTVLSLGLAAPLVGAWGMVEGCRYLVADSGRYARDATGRPLAP